MSRVPAQTTVDDLARLLFQQDQVITYRQARQHLSESTVRHRVRSGRWRRAHRSVYVTHTGPLTRDQRLWIAVLGCGTRSALAGLTAAIRCGLVGFTESRIHIIRPALMRTSAPPPGVVVHRSTVLGSVDVNWRAGPPYTTHARSLVDAAAWADSDDRARAVIAAGFQQRLVGGDEIHEVVHRQPTLRRRALILATANDARDGSQSLPELRYLASARRAGLPEPSRQHRRTDASGRVRYLDVYYQEWGVQVEIDGGQHLEVRAYWADMARQNDLWIAGDRLLRFPAWLIRDRPQEAITQVRRALMAAGWQPPSRTPS
ncbi:hypothetical protein BDK92_1403 [Micromonospora pisi]|uniref:AbiEi antitoxin N-terminal domain-containing protein n=1 Tax=Micromonospora pisi TaxID=589240 RepID=A0A495JDP2_9ACTN|nr:type IV toxin-antitoxin system AbiEi family antitoxin domain-containing protein [Micromonospora pisi]RKR87130.1 hypothetical protein BDK92_1403 [Micromonospora pisi]